MPFSGAAELSQAQEVFEAIRRLFKGKPRPKSRSWENGLNKRKEAALQRAQSASEVTEDRLARQAVLLLMKQDLLEGAYEGISAFLQDSGLPDVDALVQKLREYNLQLLQEWHALLGQQESKRVLALQTKQAALQEALSSAEEARQATADVGDVLCQVQSNQKAMETELQTLGKANAAMSREIQRCLTRINSSRASGHGEGPQHILTKHPPSKQTPSDLTASKDSSSTNSPTVVSSGSKQPFLDGDANVSIHVDLASTKDAKAWPEGETPLHLRNGVTHPHIRLMALEDGNLQRDISLSPRCAQAAGDATPRAAHVKELSRRQLKDLLADVFASKTRADARLIKQRQPRETMDQHLVAYLTQKFGLRPLVREWRRNVITAITHFQDTDPEIYLFGKVLRNEIDEEFQTTVTGVWQRAEAALQEQVQASTDTASFGQDKNQPASKGSPDKKEAAGKSSISPYDLASALTEEGSARLLSQLLGSVQLEQRAKDLITHRFQHPMPRRSSTSSDGSASHRVSSSSSIAPHPALYGLVQAVQTVLIQEHEALLKPINSAFYKVDREHTGLLSAPQFADFCRVLNPGIKDQEIAALLSSMLSNTEQWITFSSCASMLAAELKRAAAGPGPAIATK